MGKTTLTDVGFVIEPILDAIEKGLPLVVLYFSFEIDRVSKEFDFVAHFLFRDYGIEEVELPDGVRYEKKSTVPMSAKYLRGRLTDDDGNLIKVNEDITQKVIEIYGTRIRQIFGKYNAEGKCLEPGYIRFYEERMNPTGVRNKIFEYAEANGKFIKTKFQHKQTKKKHTVIHGYNANNPDETVLVVCDHLRKLQVEAGLYQMKDRVDKYSEYAVEFRNWCNYAFVHVIHLNRSLADPARLAYAKDMLYPTGDDFKDTGNLSEDCDFVFTMMNPNDQRYHLDKHFGKKIRNAITKDELYPKMRTVHLVESRHCDFPLHWRLNMHGNIKRFDHLVIPD